MTYINAPQSHNYKSAKYKRTQARKTNQINHF